MLVSREMHLLDKVFEVVFARCRRKMGESNLKEAWRFASFTLSGYLLLPIAGWAALLALGALSVMGFHGPIEQQSATVLQISAVVAGLLATVLLDRRFKTYLLNVPRLPALESRQDTLLIIKFRAASIGAFLVACVAAVMWFMFVGGG